MDTVKQSFAFLVKNLSDVEATGLWLNPFRGIPRGQRLSRFDVIYLDANCRVLEFAENFTVAEFEPFQGEAATALVLPPHTLSLIQIQKSDQLRICSKGKAGRPLKDLAFSTVHEGSQSICDIGQSTLPPKQPPYKQPCAVIPESEVKPSLKLRFLRWLFQVPAPADRRRGERIPAPGLVAYYWNGGEPKGHRLGDVSESGLYLLTEERWLPGTRIVMTLQKKHTTNASEEVSRVESKVVRWGEDGVGCEFVQSGFVDLNTGEVVDRQFNQHSFANFLQGLHSEDAMKDPSAAN